MPDAETQIRYFYNACLRVLGRAFVSAVRWIYPLVLCPEEMQLKREQFMTEREYCKTYYLRFLEFRVK